MSNLNNEALEKLKENLLDDEVDVILLKGPAGTGKSTLVKYLVDWLTDEEIGTYELLASTGRAAKILRNKTNLEVSTIHSAIYHFNGLDGDDEALKYNKENELKNDESKLLFSIASNEHIGDNCTFIVDESSMISDLEIGSVSFAVFGSGKLLTDLFQFAGNNKIIFVGDEYQLPPVSDESFSPALTADYIRDNFNKKVAKVELSEIHRFDRKGFIYHISSYYRNKIDDIDYAGEIQPESAEDISIHVNFNHFFQQYLQLIKDKDYLKATYITASNSNARSLSKIVRERLFPGKTTVQKNDLLLVTQNSNLYGLYNGDLIRVLEISKRLESTYGITFLQLKVQELISNEEKEILMIEDLIYQNQTNIDSKQHQKLLIEFTYRCKQQGIRPKTSEYYMAMYNDPYLNAVRAKFGYAITCHKSQGSEWEHVFVRMQPYIETFPFPKPYQWKYTAITRASQKLHIIRGSLNLKVKTKF